MIGTLGVAPSDLARQTLDALLAHRLRSVLSIVGIVVGIATVVTTLAIAEGARRAALNEIGALGIDNLYVRAAAADSEHEKGSSAPVLTLRDVRAIADALDNEVSVSAARVARVEARGDDRHEPAWLAGVGVEWREIVAMRLESGRWLSDADERRRRRVAVLGSSVARDLFPAGDAIGERVWIGGNWYLVVGRLHGRAGGQSGAGIGVLDMDHAVFVPLSAMDVSTGVDDGLDRVHEIGVRLSGSGTIEPSVAAVTALMQRRHRGEARYEMIVPRELLRARLRAQQTFNFVLYGIGGLALLISGVGIMNIMLASVAERTREIGVRRAFGARRSQIVAQVACEAVLLCVIGASLGVPAGIVLSATVIVVAGWPVSISLSAIVLALVLATSVGLTFGIYPARVAASLSPIDALRTA